MKNVDFRGCSTSYGSAVSRKKPMESHLAPLAHRQLEVALGLLLLAVVSGYALYLGGGITTDVTPTHIHVEVVGRPR